MSESISDILARVAGEAPSDDVQIETVAPAVPDAASDAEQAADDLRRQVEAATRRADEAQARAEAERRARAEAERRAQDATQHAEVTSQAAVTNALSAAKAEADRLQGELASAFEAGDYRKAAALQLEVGRAGARIEQLEAGQQSFEQRRTDALRREPERQAQPSDPIEADLAKRTPRTAAWLRDHRQFYTDPKFQARVMAAHNLAVADDIAPDTDAYFDFVERTVGLKSETPPPAPRGTSAPPPAAPPSRGAPSMSGGARTGDIIITAEDRRVAEWIGVTPEEYAKERERLQRSGEIYRHGRR